VIFSDISDDLVRHSEALARQMGLSDRCRFVHASADNLSMLADGSVDAVTTRSVLIYISAKQQAFHEFRRVLRPDGTLSIFEPVSRFAFPEPPDQIPELIADHGFMLPRWKERVGSENQGRPGNDQNL
jgi:arsenite methyltransferase